MFSKFLNCIYSDASIHFRVASYFLKLSAIAIAIYALHTCYMIALLKMNTAQVLLICMHDSVSAYKNNSMFGYSYLH